MSSFLRRNPRKIDRTAKYRSPTSVLRDTVRCRDFFLNILLINMGNIHTVGPNQALIVSGIQQYILGMFRQTK